MLPPVPKHIAKLSQSGDQCFLNLNCAGKKPARVALHPGGLSHTEQAMSANLSGVIDPYILITDRSSGRRSLASGITVAVMGDLPARL
jgi:hypothetical protein